MALVKVESNGTNDLHFVVSMRRAERGSSALSLLQPIDDVEIGQQTRVGVNVVFRIARDPEDAQAQTRRIVRANRDGRRPPSANEVQALDDPWQPVTMGHQQRASIGTPLHDDVARVEMWDRL